MKPLQYDKQVAADAVRFIGKASDFLKGHKNFAVTTRGHFYWDTTAPAVLLIITGGVASRPSKANAVTKAGGTVIGHFVPNCPPLGSYSSYWRLMAHLLTDGAGPMETFSQRSPLSVFVKQITRQVDFQHCWLGLPPRVSLDTDQKRS